MTDDDLAIATHAIAKADGWTDREITGRAMGELQWQTYEVFARAALTAVEAAKDVTSTSASSKPRHEGNRQQGL
jgi:hypothetical protein